MNHFITLAEAIDLTARYRAQSDSLLQPGYQGQGLLPLSESFDRSAVDALLAQEGCAGLRIYGGMNEQLEVHAVLVAYDGNGADILPSTVAMGFTAEEDVILENSLRCPPTCPTESPLNS
jgi:hypothetical protein